MSAQDYTTPRPSTSLSAIPDALGEAVAHGSCVVLVGASNRLGALAAELARECGMQDGAAQADFAAVARDYQAVFERQQLVQRLRDWLERHNAAPTPLQHAIAGLPVRRIVDFGYDGQIARALQQARRPVSLVVRDHELPFADRERVLVVRPYGVIDQSDSLLLTEPEIYRVSADTTTHRLLRDQLRIWAATEVLLWVAIDPQDAAWRRLQRAMTSGIHARHRREYALVTDGDQAAIWESCGITPLAVPDPVTWLAALAEAAAAVPPLAPAVLTDGAPGRRPYKFLDYYTADDADLFYGREAWIADLTARIQAQPLVVLWGTSGVGKTSLLRAGVLPALAGDGYWPVVYARPAADPLAALRAAAEKELAAAERVALAELEDLGDFLAAAGARRGATPVIVLDQAEECFTTLPAVVRERWVAALARALATHAADLRWVLSLREDFAADLHDWTGRVPTLFDQTVRLEPLTRDEAREAIAQPPRQVGVAIEAALVEQLLDDLTLAGVAPAQLQIVCERLYQARSGHNGMTLAGYAALGGHTRILAEYVDFALARLPRERRELAVALLKRMVTGRETKAPLRAAEILDAVEGAPAEKQAVLDGLVDARLVRSLSTGGERRYELVHEVLVEKVRSWIDDIEREASVARDLLRQEHLAHEQYVDVLPEREKLVYLYRQRENPHLHLDAADLTLLLRAALQEDVAPDYWTGRVAETGLDVWSLLAPALESEDERLRQTGLRALSGWNAPRALEALRGGMSDPSPRVRVVAHQVLFGVGTPQALAILDTSDDLRLVPAGAFSMGSGGNAHELLLEAYFVEKYPVSNGLFAQFIEAGGYDVARYWTRAGWRWRRRTRRAQPTYWQQEKWNQPNYPVVGVTWHEAWAYAAWAGRRLLTEAEWEKAATWDAATGSKRVYPWGDAFDPQKCNTSESSLGRTTPVGTYAAAGDASPYGCHDMAGNVWEWTSSLYRGYPFDADDGRESSEALGRRVQRGGSYYSDKSSARGVYRTFSNPAVGFNDDYGLRCGVVSRSFSHPLLDADS